MARVWYGVWGDGRGHAARARTMVERLRPRHAVSLFAAGDALELLEPLYRGSDVAVERLLTMSVRYAPSGRVSALRSVAGNAAYAFALRRRVARLAERMRAEEPDLAVVDFEPLLARAARSAGVPFASLDHQHALAVGDLSSLPRSLRLLARALGAVVRRFHRGAAVTIVPTFHPLALREGSGGRALRVGVLIRPEVRRATPRDGEHLVAYFRRSAPRSVLEALAECGREVRLYGLGARPPRGRMLFRPVDEEGFVRDIASCAAVASTAGNQLVGEAFFLGKPVLGLVDPRDHEQRINAHYLRASGGGDAVSTGELTAERVRSFLERLTELRRAASGLAEDGTDAALAALEALLPPRAEPAAESSPSAAALARSAR